MELDKMDLERSKRTDPAFSARAEFPKIPVKFDKFTGFFDKFLKIVIRLTDCNKMSYHINLSVSHSGSAIKKIS